MTSNTSTWQTYLVMLVSCFKAKDLGIKGELPIQTFLDVLCFSEPMLLSCQTQHTCKTIVFEFVIDVTGIIIQNVWGLSFPA